MTISTESQMAPTRRIVNFMAHDPVPAGRTGSTEGLSEFYPYFFPRPTSLWSLRFISLTDVRSFSAAARRSWVSLSRDRLAAAEKDLTSVKDRKSTRLNSSHSQISYAVFCF